MKRVIQLSEAEFVWFPPLITVIICYLGHSMIKKYCALVGGVLATFQRRNEDN